MSLPLAANLPSTTTIIVVLALCAVALAVLVPLLAKQPEALPLLAVLALPFRVPIAASGRTVNLLIPLYVVIGAGLLARLWRSRGRLDWLSVRPDGPADGAGAPDGGAATLRARWLSPRGVEALLFAAVALYALQILYSADRAKGAENLAFFYVPFVLLFVLLREVRWTRELLVRCLLIALALALVFAGIGFVEYARKSLFLNPKVVAANEYDNYFRVNSLFFDPNIYGRFLALVMLALTTAVLWARRRVTVLLGALALAWLLAGLIMSFSQSSIAALLLGLVLLSGWRWRWRETLYAAAGLLALAGAIFLLAPAGLHFGLKGSSGSTSNATSGRTKLIEGGLELFAKRPLEGFGAGSFEKEYERNSGTGSLNATSASHTIPITVAAEQGIVGLAVYVALLVAAFVVLCSGAGRSPPRVAIAACFAALVLHTWTYADFLEDPSTWVLLAIGLALARTRTAAAPRTPALVSRECSPT
jgi:O-antigen ligase